MAQQPPTEQPSGPPPAAAGRPSQKGDLPHEIEGEAYPGHFGGVKDTVPRERAERTDEEKALLDQGHTIADAMRIAGSDNALAK